MSQFFSTGAGQVWVGTGGNLPTRVVFPGGGPSATGASAVVTELGAKQGIAGIRLTDAGSGFTDVPGCIAVGGGAGFLAKGRIADGKVAGYESIPNWPREALRNNGHGIGYKASDGSFAWEFLGWTEGPVVPEFTYPATPLPTGMSGFDVLAPMEARVTLTIKRFNQDVLDRALARSRGGQAVGSEAGLRSIGAARTTVSAGSSAMASFAFFPLIVRASNATCPAKAQFYGAEFDGQRRDPSGVLPKGFHFPAASISAISDPFSASRARAVRLAITCHRVSCPQTGAGLIFDRAIGEIAGLIPY